ncbi:putative zinc-binding peptidase [Hymenobacter sp. BRD128]|uniref:zinc-binding metallopeptidase family protein n=1 Tax=Hymenobacter sp. BRD128 TaxID=2675878 RepID=UPI001564F243|nr:putative zinc-binding peptidase [Hymenobacter sp. BRD128]QKG58688.1 putative zinc-binding peptidase [Hymenobacter sp. BRD128]
MKLFTCTHCGQVLYFENSRCEKCQYPLGFEATRRQLLPLEALPEAHTFHLYGEPESPAYSYCANHEHGVCNWLVPSESTTSFCPACALNRTIPDLAHPGYLGRWRDLETAKHRLVYSLLCLHLPVVSKSVYPKEGLQFDFKADESSGQRVLTGHDNGLITINIAEADTIEREQARQSMNEVYRTLLGHFRHEVGHYYWDRLLADSPNLAGFRHLFGDEQLDYGEALKMHYAQGAPPDWPQHYISAYASSHPWEDWAETWAHYLHILDTLQTAHAFGLRLDPLDAAPSQGLRAAMQDPYQVADFGQIMAMWLPLTFAMNSLNRSMGQPDPYPFIISPAVADKLAFIHKVAGGRGGLAPAQQLSQ